MSKRHNRKRDKFLRPKKVWADYNPAKDCADPDYAKGAESERRVAAYLEAVKTAGIIEGYRQPKKYSKADRQGIDFWVFFKWGREALQVKSSMKAIQAALQSELDHDRHYINGQSRYLHKHVRDFLILAYHRAGEKYPGHIPIIKIEF